MPKRFGLVPILVASTLISSFPASADETTRSDESILHKYDQYGEVGDFGSNDPTFNPSTVAIPMSTPQSAIDWKMWHLFRTAIIGQRVYKKTPASLKEKDLRCHFSFLVTDQNKVQSLKILESSGDKDFDCIVRSAVEALGKLKGRFPQSSKEQKVMVVGTCTSKPNVQLEVTTLGGLPLVKRKPELR